MVHTNEANGVMDDCDEELGMGENSQYKLVWWDINYKAKGVVLCELISQLELFSNTVIV